MIEIFHVSDLHFGKSKRRTARAKLLLRKIKQKFGMEKGGNRYLLITGDIVEHGRIWQYRNALKALLPFKENVRVVPGNHDYGFKGFIYARKCAKNFDEDLATLGKKGTGTFFLTEKRTSPHFSGLPRRFRFSHSI